MFEIILYQPEIPPNTGNIIRLCANTDCRLHLIGPLGFTLEDSKLRRAGLDYHEWAKVRQYACLADCLAVLKTRCFAFSSKVSRLYTDVQFQPGDAFLFGPESRGLPPDVLGSIPTENQLRIAQKTHARSLNLSNCVSIVVYEAWRQQGFL
ncbi:MAG: tRNA (cytidine(34)-2'-O)-methyltransferase [Gammaproteobacteria bacterium]